MSAMQRRKGQSGEREIFRLLTDQLGFVVKRRLGAAREGGCDSLDVPGWAIEVKRTESYQSAFWFQARRQAQLVDRRPVLFWRKSRCPWSVYVRGMDLAPEVFSFSAGQEPIQISLEQWCELARALMTND